MSERYALFAGEQYYPGGGTSDFRAFGTIEELEALFEENREEWFHAGNGIWGEIVDPNTMLVVLMLVEPYHEERSEWGKLCSCGKTFSESSILEHRISCPNWKAYSKQEQGELPV